MQIQKINNTSFQSKKHVLNNSQLYKMKMLLTRMNKETSMKKTDTDFVTTMTSALKSKDSQFIDTRFLVERVKAEKQMTGRSMLIMDKTTVVIDNSTGEIIDWKKPIMTCWHRIMKNVDKNINFFYENFYNSRVVKKKRITLEGFTQKGIEILRQAKGKING